MGAAKVSGTAEMKAVALKRFYGLSSHKIPKFVHGQIRIFQDAFQDF